MGLLSRMIANILLFSGTAVGLLTMLDLVLTNTHKKVLASWSVRLWDIVDNLKRDGIWLVIAPSIIRSKRKAGLIVSMVICTPLAIMLLCYSLGIIEVEELIEGCG